MIPQHLRIARPVGDLVRAEAMYCQGLGLHVVGRFENHDGFDGVMLGQSGAGYHFEFTYCRTAPIVPQPTPEDLVVCYFPTIGEWEQACANMLAAGFTQVISHNPYWDVRGRTYQDADGYRIVLENAAWDNKVG